MLLPELFETAAAFERVGIRYRLFGGSAAELVTGRDIRPHGDVFYSRVSALVRLVPADDATDPPSSPLRPRSV